MPKISQQDTQVQAALTKLCDSLDANEPRCATHISLPQDKSRWKSEGYLGAQSWGSGPTRTSWVLSGGVGVLWTRGGAGARAWAPRALELTREPVSALNEAESTMGVPQSSPQAWT